MATKKARKKAKRIAPRRKPTRTTTRKKRTSARRKTKTAGAGGRTPPPERPTAKRCLIRTARGDVFRIACGDRLRQFALEWDYACRHRRRWYRSRKAREALSARAREHLVDLGLREQDIGELGDAGMLEVSIHFATEREGWETRVMPWEFLISAATKQERGERRLTIVRHLHAKNRRPERPQATMAMIVESAPGPFAELYEFDAERRVVLANLRDLRGTRLVNPTLAGLVEALEGNRPDVVHLTGIDAHQGAARLGLGRTPTRDGFYLAAKPGKELLVSAEALATKLNSPADYTPSLVAFNAYNSAPRLAALTVAYGAGAALGFQGAIDDAMAEVFLATFYNVWRHSGYQDLLHAFDVAWGELTDDPTTSRGSGIVLWSERPLVYPEAPAYEWRQDRLRGALDEGSPQYEVEVERATTVRIGPEEGESRKDAALRILDVYVEPVADMNYSVLHNGGDIFRAFDLRQLVNGTLRGIEVEAILYVGDASFPYKGTFDRDNSMPPSIKHNVRIPLTWDFVRTVKESIRTSLYVRVRYEDTTLYEDTHQVTLPPVNEWLDNERDGKWLPSFVLPRDAEVARIVRRARHYLCALLDDPSAGFDGYQSFDPAADDPAESIDLQVRAIWTAFLLEYELGYINPPPSYAESSQRLRSPTEVIGAGQGTCIDLTLLLASCLEYVEIYPVIFLLKGHAFPGYWRSEEAYDRFLSMTEAPHEASPDEPQGDDGSIALPPWMAGPESYAELVQLVRDDDLVPLESVSLTANERFTEAFEKGLENIQAEDEFDGMIDVLIARDSNVTPLPL